jgi:hypothetical protein
MDCPAEFLQSLLYEGRIVFRGRPIPAPSASVGAVAVLERAYAAYRLEVAGPPVPFDARVAVEAAELVRQAGWALVNHDARPEQLERLLAMSLAPTLPAHHLSADLVFRFLPQIHRRARAFDPADVLPALLAEVLRQWPLSGVLAALDEGPPAPPDLGGHPGLALLYAERLAAHEAPAWAPAGDASAYLERVRHGLGRSEPHHA